MKLTLETERLVLRPFELNDSEAMFTGWANDPEVTKYLTWPPHESMETTKRIVGLWVEQYEKPERLNFAITLKENGALIGGIDVVGYLGGVSGTPVLGYAMSRKFWGNGYMTEACRAVLTLLFAKGYPEVRIDAVPENIGSIRVIEKCGGEFLMTQKEDRPLKNDSVFVNRYVVRRSV